MKSFKVESFAGPSAEKYKNRSINIVSIASSISKALIQFKERIKPIGQWLLQFKLKKEINVNFDNIVNGLAELQNQIDHFRKCLGHEAYSGMLSASTQINDSFHAIKNSIEQFKKTYDQCIRLENPVLIQFAKEKKVVLQTLYLPNFISNIFKLREQLDACWVKASQHPNEESARLYLEAFINGCKRYINLYNKALQAQEILTLEKVVPKSRRDYNVLCNADQHDLVIFSPDEKRVEKKIYVDLSKKAPPLHYKVFCSDGSNINSFIDEDELRVKFGTRYPLFLSALTENNKTKQLEKLKIFQADIRSILAKRGHTFVEPYATIKQLLINQIDDDEALTLLLKYRNAIPKTDRGMGSDKREGSILVSDSKVPNSSNIVKRISHPDYHKFWQDRRKALEILTAKTNEKKNEERGKVLTLAKGNNIKDRIKQYEASTVQR